MVGSWHASPGAAALATLVTLASACAEDPASGDLIDGLFTADEWSRVEEFGPLPAVPPDPTNRYADDPAAAALGQRLFFEKSYSGALTVGDDGTNGSPGAVGETGKLACASCHLPSSWWMDTRTSPNAVSLGVKYTTRNAPSLVNVAHYAWFGWGGKQDSLWNQAAGSPESADNTGGNRLGYAHMLYAKYRADYDAIFDVPLDPALDPLAPDAARFPAKGKPKATASDPDGPWEQMAEADRQIVLTIMANCGKAIAAYERLLVSADAPFDRYVLGDGSAISTSARRGLKLFIGKAACDSCHTGPTFTDNQFYNTGVPQAVGEHVPEVDEGRYTDIEKLLKNTFRGDSSFSDDVAAGAEKLGGLAREDADRGRFRTKALRAVSRTGPYMHNGSYATLAEVVHFYNVGGGPDGSFAGTRDPLVVPLNLGVQEEADLVAFLETLLGASVPAALQKDTSAP